MTYIWGRRGRSLPKDHAQDRQQEGSSLAGAGLGTSHEIPTSHNDGESVLLHWSRLGVLRQLRGWEGRRKEREERERGGKEKGWREEKERERKEGRGRSREKQKDEGKLNMFVGG